MLAGAAVIALGLAMIIIATGFPTVPGMQFGPGLFPKIIGGGLLLSGVGILVEAFGRASGEGASRPGIRQLLLVGAIAFFALTLHPLGFHVSAAITIFAATLLARGGLLTTLILTCCGPIVLHFIFYSVMRVPLPWGILLPIAW